MTNDLQPKPTKVKASDKSRSGEKGSLKPGLNLNVVGPGPRNNGSTKDMSIMNTEAPTWKGLDLPNYGSEVGHPPNPVLLNPILEALDATPAHIHSRQMREM